MSPLSTAVAALTPALVVSASVGAVVLLAWWLKAAADLAWMIRLRPAMAGGVVVGLVACVAALVGAALAWRGAPAISLPVIAGLMAAPLARPLIDALARREFRRSDAGFDIDDDALGAFDLFSLVQAQQDTRYVPPTDNEAPQEPP